MYDRILHRMRERIADLRYALTLHAEEEMNDDGLTVLDVERIILTGKIIDRQKDSDTIEWKYVIKGHTFQSREGCVAVKFGATGMVVVITVFLD